ncbi:MFS transporter [Pseudoduganella albidiflava]|uniref:MFS transporter n=1 Tax=Pseudoduganella albidiflava TaxID=321983 RepID=A0A411WVB3_9BURK|nr:MFS transporter [Pseudoduganella albidiflava]QBI00733.1 MFS transporter [Pseudoduganella albidiflava]GGY31063.1 MFS transporter [Pseudoduganella albidiflava]
MKNEPTFRQDARVIGLVGLAHGTSHFYHLILAALFPWLKPAFNLSYSQLGLLMTVFFVVSGVGQACAGFVVDRVGARRVLFFGVGMLGVSALVLSVAGSYAALMAGALLAGIGNSIFHPADYTLLNQRVSRERLAHGFSVHGISGNLGWAASPLFMTTVAALASWRTALALAALLPFAVLVVLVLNRHALRPNPPQHTGTQQAGEGTLAFLRLPSVWMCFAFFFLTAVSLGGIQAFSSIGLEQLYGISRELATSSYTAYMLASAAGMVVGGFVGAGSGSHDRNIAIAFAIAAALALVLGMAVVPGWLALPLMALIGFCSGVAGPSRDLMIRAAAPKNATGRVYGVVYSGLDTGLSVGPLMFGAVMDAGHPGWLFAGIALFQALAIGTAVGVGGSTRAVALKNA